MTSQEEQRELNKKAVSERLEVVESKVKDTIVVPKEEYEKLKQELEDNKKIVQGLANYLLNLTTALEEAGKRMNQISSAVFTLSDQIKAIARPQAGQPQQQQQ